MSNSGSTVTESTHNYPARDGITDAVVGKHEIVAAVGASEVYVQGIG